MRALGDVTRRIVLTNDDGLDSPGLQAAHDLMANFGALLVVVPDSDRTASGCGMTIRRPLVARPSPYPPSRTELRPAEPAAWVVSGTPVDCVKLACVTLCRPRPTFVVSGINIGENVGTGILYSGTVAAALEAAINGVPAVAISLREGNVLDYSAAARLVRPVILDALERGIPPWSLLNVNVPNIPEKEVRGVRVTPMGVSGWVEQYDTIDHHTDGTQSFALRGSFVVRDDDDAKAVRDGWISVSVLGLRLSVDTTALAGWLSLNGHGGAGR